MERLITKIKKIIQENAAIKLSRMLSIKNLQTAYQTPNIDIFLKSIYSNDFIVTFTLEGDN